ncbi:sulfite exporter TauE/SafE family protein [Vibrio sp. SCSIO 43136]|uniref:sulfite exporter TauE/SafE family protein n=1 Tax=Vibrio sp. SCSIO 43136 TaxID=2819101 RepID=UPI00218AD697|nr:sulfite exporter TauE/SafE family protein [Vibrio sp. SCSIO 43136]USD64879.1 sulfite exporter TauE/SafE family protein [Vibrio sp. SCSIO 43136]
MDVVLIAEFLLLGAFVGIMAGLLGIGGGLIVVPALVWLLPQAQVNPDIVMHLALGTSLASIILTSGSSAWNHLRLGNVDMFVVKWLLPGVIIGGAAGAFIADAIPSAYLGKVFGAIVLMLSIQMFVSIKTGKVRPMPGQAKTLVSGSAIGVISSLAGIGGGSLTVPYLNRYGVEMRRAIGSSSVCGCVLAIAGMTGFIINGANAQGLPAYSVGYVYLPALFGIAATSMLTTKLGARLATSLPTPILKKIFAVFLLFIAAKMLLPV